MYAAAGTISSIHSIYLCIVNGHSHCCTLLLSGTCLSLAELWVAFWYADALACVMVSTVEEEEVELAVRVELLDAVVGVRESVSIVLLAGVAQVFEV